MNYRALLLSLIPLFLIQPLNAQDWRGLFDGYSMKGWEGDSAFFRIEKGSIVGGRLTDPIPQNEFLCTTETFDNFVVRLQFRLEGEGTNAGVQFRSERVPGSSEVAGYQADLGEGVWGALYDESRRNQMLAQPDADAVEAVLDRNGWNEYAIYASGKRIRLFVNGLLTVDYIEQDETVPQSGRTCLQIHSGPPGEAWYRDVRIKPIKARPEEPFAATSETVRFEKHVLIPRFVAEGLGAGDVDGDGDLDLVAGAYIIEAPGWTLREFRPATPYSVHNGYSDTFLSYTLDVNLDGRIDVIQFGAPGAPAYWYENPGDTDAAWARRLVHPSVGSENPRLEDVDGDGRPDLLFLDRQADQFVWMQAPTNPGDTVWTRHEISKQLEKERSRRLGHGLGFGDVNGDGLPDVIAIDAWWEAPGWEEHPAELGNPAADMHAFDVDGDGDSDVLSSSAHGYGIWWYEQGDGNGAGWTRHTIDDRTSQTHALEVADLNGDGLTDFVTGKRFFAHNGNDPGAFEPSELLWYAAGRDENGRPTWTPYLIDEDAGVGLQVLVLDLTGDGLTDVAVSNKKGVFLFEQVRE